MTERRANMVRDVVIAGLLVWCGRGGGSSCEEAGGGTQSMCLLHVCARPKKCSPATSPIWRILRGNASWNPLSRLNVTEGGDYCSTLIENLCPRELLGQRGVPWAGN